MKKIRYTVLKTTFNSEIAKEYGAENIGICPMHRESQQFIGIGERQPQGLCDEAWKAFSHYAFALVHGANGFWEDWIPERKISINCCNDGIRPVIFKLELIEED